MRSDALILAAAIAVFAPAGAAAAPSPSAPAFFKHSCAEQLNAPKGTRCGIVVVPENRTQPAGKTIGLNVMVLAATGGSKQNDAIFVIAGGPGEPTADANGMVFATITGAAHVTRDIVLIDQRGTGGSRPLQCDVYPGSGPARFFAPEWPTDIYEKCAERLGAIADLSQYSTENAADDLDAVRAALGYDRVDLLGASYGTSVALAYMRRHADRVRSAVLDAVVALDARIPLPYATAAQHALDALFADCGADTACHAALPNIRSDFTSVLAQLAKGPANAQVTDPLSGAKSAVQIDLPMWVAAVRDALYDTANANSLLRLIRAAARGNFDPSADYIASVRGDSALLYSGMAMSVECPEDVDAIDPQSIAGATRGSFFGDYRVRQEIAACDVWPQRDVDPSFFAPVRSNAPVLMLTGGLDPRTPPEEAARVQRYLPHAVDVVFPHQSHASNTPCEQRLVGAFINTADVRGLDTSCAAQEQRPPFTP